VELSFWERRRSCLGARAGAFFGTGRAPAVGEAGEGADGASGTSIAGAPIQPIEAASVGDAVAGTDGAGGAATTFTGDLARPMPNADREIGLAKAMTHTPIAMATTPMRKGSERTRAFARDRGAAAGGVDGALEEGAAEIALAERSKP